MSNSNKVLSKKQDRMKDTDYLYMQITTNGEKKWILDLIFLYLQVLVLRNYIYFILTFYNYLIFIVYQMVNLHDGYIVIETTKIMIWVFKYGKIC